MKIEIEIVRYGDLENAAQPGLQAVVAIDERAENAARIGDGTGPRIATAGFGDFEVARTCHPRLSTVAVDCVGIGRAAGELLLRAIDAARSGQRLPAETVLIPFRIVQRESS